MLVIHTINPEKDSAFLRHIKITNKILLIVYNIKYDIRFQVQFTVRSAYH